MTELTVAVAFPDVTYNVFGGTLSLTQSIIGHLMIFAHVTCSLL